MNRLARRAAFTVTVTLLAAAAASAGVLAWRAVSPPPVELAVAGAPPPAAVLEGSREGLAVGQPRPAFSMPDTEGTLRSVSEWDGKLLFINFWATWGERGLQFLGVALDRADNVRSFMAEQQMNYPSLHSEREALELARVYGNTVGGLPYTVLVGRDGKVLKLHQGILHEDEARALIERHL
jgi:peroxiredoxin